jgi:hypothetical protein
LQVVAWLTAAAKPILACQARAAIAMDTLNMTFDPPARLAFPQPARDRHALGLKDLLG